MTIQYYAGGVGPFDAKTTWQYRSTGTSYSAGDSVVEAASVQALVGRSLSARMERDLLSGESVPAWDTDLWQRSAKQTASRQINHLTGLARLARGARAKTKIELQMMSLENQVRRLNK